MDNFFLGASHLAGSSAPITTVSHSSGDHPGPSNIIILDDDDNCLVGPDHGPSNLIVLDDEDNCAFGSPSTVEFFQRSDHVSSHTSQSRDNLLRQEHAVDNVNTGDGVVNGGRGSVARLEEAESGMSTEPASPGIRSGQHQQSLIRTPRGKEYFEIARQVLDGCLALPTYLPCKIPRMTMSHMLNCWPMEEFFIKRPTWVCLWNVEELTDEEIRLRIKGVIRREEAGISENTILRRLNTRVYTTTVSSLETEELDSCGICTGKYKAGESIADLYYCPHEFHANCIKKWLLEKNTCPLCRSLALIPEHFPDYVGDTKLHRAFFNR